MPPGLRFVFGAFCGAENTFVGQLSEPFDARRDRREKELFQGTGTSI
jgi:hypothetical protein